MTIVCFSDTHMKHHKIKLPLCDIAIFAGDYTHRGKLSNAKDFLDWYSNQDQCRYKIFIAGNHDIHHSEQFMWETNSDLWLKPLLEEYNNLIYLENSLIEIEGLRIWGSPVTPWFHGDYWAFNKERGYDIQQVWNKIPDNLDILVTHGPPYGVLDLTPGYEHAGCEELRFTIKEKKPKYSVFGHIHIDEDIERIVPLDDTLCINASVLDNSYNKIIDPITIEI